MEEVTLIHACVNSHTDTVKQLLETGTDPNAQNGRALVYAARAGIFEPVERLLAHGAVISAEAIKASSAHMLAELRQYITSEEDLLELLVSRNEEIREFAKEAVELLEEKK